MLYKVYKCDTYFKNKYFIENNFELFDLETLKTELYIDKFYNIRINENDTCILYGDIDHFTGDIEYFQKQLILFINKYVQDCGYSIELDYNDCKLTKRDININNEESYHYSIPKINMTVKDMKYLHEEFKNHFSSYSQYIDTCVYSNRFFRLPNQSKGKSNTNIKHSGIHRIIKGSIEDFIIHYIPNVSTYVQIMKNTEKKKQFEKELKHEQNKNNDSHMQKIFIPNTHLVRILNEKNKNFYNEIQFWQFTTVMKTLNQFELWDKFNKQRNNYDLENNIKIWNTVNPNKAKFNLLLKLNTYSKGYYCLKKVEDITIETIKLNQRYIGKDFLRENINYVIKSDCGTGKTQAVKSFIEKNNYNFISIVSRRSLSYEQFEIFKHTKKNVLHYWDDFKTYRRFTNNDNIIIQVDSLLKIHRNIELNNFVVILDEFESIVEYIFTSNTMTNKRVTIFIKFIEIMKKCRNFICIDADITYKSIEFIHTFIQRNVMKYENMYISNNNIPAYEIESETTFLSNLKKEKKFLLCTDSANKAKWIYNYLDDSNVLLITSEQKENKNTTHENDKKIDFDAHDKIIYSPKIIYGIDSKMRRNVYCFYKEHTINPKAMVQQISRCRNIQNVYYHFQRKRYIENNMTLEKVIQINKDIVQYGVISEKSIIETGFYIISPEIENKYINLFSKFEYENICYNTNKHAHFLKLLQERGFHIKNDNILINVTLEKKEKIKYNEDVTFEEFFKITKNKKILDIIDISYDNIILRQQFHIIKKYYFIRTFFAYKYFFFDHVEDKYLRKSVDEQDEFIISKISNIKQKIRFLIKFKELCGCTNRKSIDCTQLISPEIHTQIKLEYKIIFDKKYYDEKIEMDNIIQLNKFMAKLYKNIFDNNIIITKRRIDKITKKKNRFYIINEEEYNNYFQLYSYSKNT